MANWPVSEYNWNFMTDLVIISKRWKSPSGRNCFTYRSVEIYSNYSLVMCTQHD